jgi:hypothetical protein
LGFNHGRGRFFAITKAFHNALHGGRYDLPDESFQTFLAYTEQNRARLQFDSNPISS